VSLWQTLAQLDSEAAAGSFKGSGQSYLILTYLARHAWRQEPNRESVPVGTVLSGKSEYKVIARDTNVTPKTVQRAMTWLTEHHWLKTEVKRTAKGYLGANKITLTLEYGESARAGTESPLGQGQRVRTKERGIITNTGVTTTGGRRGC
jgi:hypothetical protein